MKPNQELKLFSVKAGGGEAHSLHNLVPLDDRGDELKYVPVRRMALSVQQSIVSGSQWAIFEPNNPALWARLQSSAEGLLNGMFLQRKFKGDSPAKAYFVKCDASTTSQADLDKGIVNIVVGFAPLQPAEFVVVQIQLWLSDAKPPHQPGH